MPYPRAVVEAVEEAYTRKRAAAEDEARRRTAALYEKYPPLKAIDEALAATGPKIFAAAMKGPEGLQERIDALKAENLELQEDRARILALEGFPPDYLDVHYDCAACKDTGVAGGIICACKVKALRKAAFEASELGSSLKSQTFSTFDLSYYSDKPRADGTSDRANMENILKTAKNYVKTFGKAGRGENLLFMGGTGLGKTHLSSAIAMGVLEGGYDVVYESFLTVCNKAEAATFRHDGDAADDLERAKTCDLLVIDDLGTEMKSSFTQSVLYELLNTRINAGLAIVASTNLDDLPALKKQYDDRIISRLVGSFRSFRFVGSDVRIQKVTRRKK